MNADNAFAASRKIQDRIPLFLVFKLKTRRVVEQYRVVPFEVLLLKTEYSSANSTENALVFRAIS